jgi:hypothetical protein
VIDGKSAVSNWKHSCDKYGQDTSYMQRLQMEQEEQEQQREVFSVPDDDAYKETFLFTVQ